MSNYVKNCLLTTFHLYNCLRHCSSAGAPGASKGNANILSFPLCFFHKFLSVSGNHLSTLELNVKNTQVEKILFYGVFQAESYWGPKGDLSACAHPFLCSHLRDPVISIVKWVLPNCYPAVVARKQPFDDLEGPLS